MRYCLAMLPLLAVVVFVAGCPWLPGVDAIRNVRPVDGATLKSAETTLTVETTPANVDRDVTFFGRSDRLPGEDFAVILLPDTQYYSESYPDTFSTQTRWIVDHRTERNIAAVLHLGDIVETASVTAQWQRADAAIGILESQPDLPFGLALGNHDQSPNGDPAGTQQFNQFFPVERFADAADWYGGHYGTDNDNHYILFNGGGRDFVAVFIEYDETPDADVLEWADSVLKTHADRLAIVVTHFTMIGHLFENHFSTQGQAVFDTLKHNSNLRLILGGHFCEVGRRTDWVDGRPIHAMLSDYQCRPGGGGGWLRILTFSPKRDTLCVQTYSPTQDRYLRDDRQQFTLPFDFQTAHKSVPLATVTLPAGQSRAEYTWENLADLRSYTWYAAIDDASQPLASRPTTFSRRNAPTD